MTIENINVEESVAKVTKLLAEEKNISPAMKLSIEVLLTLVSLLLKRLGLNSKNSSKPPSTDRFRAKEPKAPTGRKPGGQAGHVGTTLVKYPVPDVVKTIAVDQSTLPPGVYREVGFDARQVVDVDITTCVTEFRAQVLEDQNGNRYTAPFPDGVTRPVQYGIGVNVNGKVKVYQFRELKSVPANWLENGFSQVERVESHLLSGRVVLQRHGPEVDSYAPLC